MRLVGSEDADDAIHRRQHHSAHVQRSFGEFMMGLLFSPSVPVADCT